MRVSLALSVCALLASGCASSNDGGAATSTAGDSGATTTPADSGATTADAGTNAADAAPAALTAPRLDSLMKMSGALHVNWTNLQSGCDTVRVERKSDQGEDWTEKFSVPGTVNNKMDGTATANAVYTYRLRCAKGGAFSAYSNELSKNPTL